MDNPSKTSDTQDLPINREMKVQFPLLAHWFPISRMLGLRVFWAEQMEQGMVHGHGFYTYPNWC